MKAYVAMVAEEQQQEFRPLVEQQKLALYWFSLAHEAVLRVILALQFCSINPDSFLKRLSQEQLRAQRT